ncbi:MAG: metal-dependent hydrolase [Halobacteriales archaeon]|nr:metal-dependent hydrolase [Halobacteriales archaeon]
MPDLLTHVLLVYSLTTVVTDIVDRLPDRFVPVAMVGAILPDLSKFHLLVAPAQLTAVFGIPFSWLPFHRLGGTIVMAALASLTFDRSERRLAFGFLLGGALTQYPLDGMIERANGLSPPYFYPFTWWQPPAGGLYLSSDLWPILPAAVLASGVWLWQRFRG